MYLQIIHKILWTPWSYSWCWFHLFGFGQISSIRSMPSFAFCSLAVQCSAHKMIDQCFWSGSAPLLTIASLCFDFAVPAVAVGRSNFGPISVCFLFAPGKWLRWQWGPDFGPIFYPVVGKVQKWPLWALPQIERQQTNRRRWKNSRSSQNLSLWCRFQEENISVVEIWCI